MNCYLCHRPMEWNERFELWECPFLIQDRPDEPRIDDQQADFFPHFHIDFAHNMAAYLNDYRVVEQIKEVEFYPLDWTDLEDERILQASREFLIYKWSAKYGTWQYITSTPTFQFQSEEHLLSKIKTILTFS